MEGYSYASAEQKLSFSVFRHSVNKIQLLYTGYWTVMCSLENHINLSMLTKNAEVFLGLENVAAVRDLLMIPKLLRISGSKAQRRRYLSTNGPSNSRCWWSQMPLWLAIQLRSPMEVSCSLHWKYRRHFPWRTSIAQKSTTSIRWKQNHNSLEASLDPFRLR